MNLLRLFVFPILAAQHTGFSSMSLKMASSSMSLAELNRHLVKNTNSINLDQTHNASKPKAGN